MLRRLYEWTAREWALKLTALALAFLLWTTVRAEAPGEWSTEIDVRVINNDADWVTAAPPSPSLVTATFRGPYRELLRIAAERPTLFVPVEQVNDTTEFVQLRNTWVRMPPGTATTVVGEVQPGYVRLFFDRVATRLIPLSVRLIGAPAPGFELAGPPEIEPSAVRASGARRDLDRIDTLRLGPVDLRDRRTLDTLEMVIDTTGTGLIISPRTVRVFVPIRLLLEQDPSEP